jgi:hypothetical protein
MTRLDPAYDADHCSRTEFLCPLDANIYGIDFNSFRITDYETKRLIFEVLLPPRGPWQWTGR